MYINLFYLYNNPKSWVSALHIQKLKHSAVKELEQGQIQQAGNLI